jgi:hypothetical protein
MTHGTSPWRSNIAIGDIITVRRCPEWVERNLRLDTRPLDRAIMDRTELMRLHTHCKRPIVELPIYPVAPCTENTFANQEFEPTD